MLNQNGKRSAETVDLTAANSSDDEFGTLRDVQPKKSKSNAPAAETQPKNPSSSFGRSSSHSSSNRDDWSSTSALPSSSQTIPSSQRGSSTQPSSSTHIDLTDSDDEDDSNDQLYGILKTKIVGVRYYRGRANIGEVVLVKREPGNPYDRNAIRIDNVVGLQIGHVPRNVAAKLAPLLDSGALGVEAYLTGTIGARWP